ncbi:hypothetical protein ATJ88_3568 [Isoptericola jiangsuensis]|uniref:Uncharacterized protein n=1 Tax=Isoptericola jiangsuensis TaxID=548579 RepID=A0A2A9F230_9MICO|nr:hypothetical protein [Isoptericola jiangsuensis]PFG44831.1 hypothetical protein ATJ88_3568 [Isoptericola jiangsuensis]
MRRNLGQRLAAGLAVAALAAAAAVGTVAPAGAAADNLPGVPAPGSSDATWQEWAQQERAEAEATDWAADARTRGCTLVEATVVDEVDPAYNAAMGAPADLVTHRVDMVEDCPETPAGTLAGTLDGGLTRSDRVATTAIGSGTQCATTHGPGTICVYSSSGRIYGSWRYSGDGSVSGFLRIYRIPTSSDDCYRGDTWLTGPSVTWSSGMTRSISKTRTTYSGYSAHIWKKVTIGHTDWGRACAKL